MLWVGGVAKDGNHLTPENCSKTLERFIKETKSNLLPLRPACGAVGAPVLVLAGAAVAAVLIGVCIALVVVLSRAADRLRRATLS